MERGIPVLTQKGREALRNAQPDLTARCRNILVQVDNKRSFDDIRKVLDGLEGLDESIHKLIAGQYVQVSRECKDLVIALAEQILGPKAPTLIKKIDELHVKYGDACWEHLDEVNKTARLFYGEVVAEKLKAEISALIQQVKKS